MDIHSIIVSTVLTAIISSILGGGLGATIVRLLMRKEAQDALKEDLDKISDNFKKVNEDIERIESDYVACRVCNATHSSLSQTLKDMSHKLDLLLENALKK